MIIQSLLDTDFYKYTMAQVVLHHFPDFHVKYRFKCRNENIIWTDDMVDEIIDEIYGFCELKFASDELDYLSKIRFLKPYFIDFLGLYQPNMKYVKVFQTNGELNIEIEGPWFLTIFFEVPVLAIVNEVYFKFTSYYTNVIGNGLDKLVKKVQIAKKEQFKFSDFGTRRRYSRIWQDTVVGVLKENLPIEIFSGTSNVHLARKYNLTPIGTMAHEFIQAGQAVSDVTLVNSQKYMFQKWVDEYRGDLGIALSDTLGFDKFLKDFDLYFAKLYDGVRHDSGDPFDWAVKMIAHYETLRINPKTKTLVFSDGLDFNIATELSNAFKSKINIAFGIGTNLTNDFDGIKPLQIVIKIVECNGRPVAKISDNPKKTMCKDEDYLNYLRMICKGV